MPFATWTEMWADVDAHSCKVCGTYNCSVPVNWVLLSWKF